MRGWSAAPGYHGVADGARVPGLVREGRGPVGRLRTAGSAGSARRLTVSFNGESADLGFHASGVWAGEWPFGGLRSPHVVAGLPLFGHRFAVTSIESFRLARACGNLVLPSIHLPWAARGKAEDPRRAPKTVAFQLREG